MAVRFPKRVSIGIPGMESLLQGGIPSGSVLLISGESGTGKTIFSSQWPFYGIKQKESGIYITLTEPLFKTLQNLESMGFYDPKAVENQGVCILDAREMVNFHESSFSSKLLREIEKYVKKNRAKRLVIDSLTAILFRLQDKPAIREFIFDLGTMLAGLGCTSCLVSEIPKGRGYSAYGIEEFIADGVVYLTRKKVDHGFVRYLNIAKMRGVDFSGEYTGFSIGNDGIRLYPRMNASLASINTSKNRLSSGVPGLDDALDGGLYESSSSLVVGATGAGKSVLGRHVLAEGLDKNKKSLLCAFEEPADQIIRNAESLGMNWGPYLKKGQLIIRALYPSEQSLEQHAYEINTLVKQGGFQRCVVDSISSFDHYYGKSAGYYLMRHLNNSFKAHGTTALFTSATKGFLGSSELTASSLSTITDNIIMLRYVEVASEIRQVLNVLKIRGNSHSRALYEYSIQSGKGLMVGHMLKGFEGILTGSTRRTEAPVVDRLREEFKEFLGPMGGNEFDALLEQGLQNKEDVLNYLARLMERRILTPAQYKEFKQHVEKIFSEV